MFGLDLHQFVGGLRPPTFPPCSTRGIHAPRHCGAAAQEPRGSALLLLLLIPLLVAGCAAPAAGPIHSPPGLDARESDHVELKTDLEPQLAALVLDRLEKTERVLDAKVPWLVVPRRQVTVIVLGDEARYHEVAHSHGVNDPATGAF